MYYIYSDKRSKKSSQLIYQGLIKCLESKSLSDITVTDLYNASSVSRSTFYRLFDNVTDILLLERDLFKNDITEYINSQNASNTHEFFIGLIEICMKHHMLLKIATNQQQLHLIQNIQEHIYHTLCTHFFADQEIKQKNIDYFMTMLSMSIVGLFITWMKYGAKENSTELFEHLQNNCTYISEFYKSDIFPIKLNIT